MTSDYKIRSEYRKYKNIKIPTNPIVLKLINRMMPVIQKESRIWKDKVNVKDISFGEFSAQLISPKGYQPSSLPCLVYYHGGAFAMKAARYHKNLVRKYACEACVSVLFVDYRLTPEYKYPVPVKDCYKAYQWAAGKWKNHKLFIGGDSAGGNLAASVTIKAIQEEARIPDKIMLIYPVLDSRMITPSMVYFTDTPLWNAKQNRKMWLLYADETSRREMLVSPAESPDLILSQFPKTYVETAEFDCLRDEEIEFARRLQNCGVSVAELTTKGTVHGYDIEEKSAYVKRCVLKRISFLKR